MWVSISVFKKLLGAAMMMAVFIGGIAAAVAQDSVNDTARIPIVVNVDAVVTVTPPDGAEGAVGASKGVSANTPDTLDVVLGSSGHTSAPHIAQKRSNAPAAISYSRGSVSLKLQPQQYGKAAVSLYSINGRRVLSGRADASKASLNISRHNIAAGVYLLHVRGVKGSSYATRLTHSGGRLNINIAFANESVAPPPASARANSATGAWTITVRAEGYSDTSYAFSPVKGMNQAQNITLSVRPFVVDISGETDEWNYMVVGGDGSTILIDVNESTDIPTRMFLRPDKESDEGLTMFFKENGLPDKMVVDEHILYFDNFRGNKYDMAVIYPDYRTEYFYDIETNINWEDYIIASSLAKARFFGDVLRVLSVLPIVPAITCTATAFAPNPVTLSMCIKSTVFYVGSFVVDQIFDGPAKDLASTVKDGVDCAKFIFGVAWESYVAMLEGIDGIQACLSVATNIFSTTSNQDSELISENDWEIERAREQLIEYRLWRDGIKLGEPLSDPRNNRKYTTVVIGSQTWMAENLDYVDASWWEIGTGSRLTNRDKGTWCYENNPENCEKYGRLYTWDAAVGACPAGWRLPDDGDWNTLAATVGSNAGRKLRSRSINGTDDFGFDALLGGYRDADRVLNSGTVAIGFFDWRDTRGYWWSATEDATELANLTSRSRYISSTSLSAADLAKWSGLSVRCVQDNDSPPAKEWMNRNLNVEIPDSWCYNDDPANCEIYGRLYTWEAAKSACAARGDGWRLPTRTDWNALVNEVGGYIAAGEKLKATTGWDVDMLGRPIDNGNNGTDDVGFSAQAGGFRTEDGSSAFIGFWGFWWSTWERDGTYAYPWRMMSTNQVIGTSYSYKDNAFSVRCVRN